MRQKKTETTSLAICGVMSVIEAGMLKLAHSW